MDAVRNPPHAPPHPDPHYPAYKLYSPLPLQFSSEWSETHAPGDPKAPYTSYPADDAPLDSPLKLRMAVATQAETPPKRPRVQLVTPSRASAAKADPAAPTPPPGAAHVRAMDVLWAMLNDVTGKDKMAKLGQYTLRLVLHHAQRLQAYLSDDTVNIRAISRTYASPQKVLELVVSFAQRPREFARVLGILVCLVMQLRLAALVPALGLYRQLLRFGKTPFRVRSLAATVRANMYIEPRSGAWRVSERLWSGATLGEATALYYAVNDELLLLHKLGVLTNKRWHRIAVRHVDYAWYCELWLALYNTYAALRRLAQQEMDVRIQIQVKRRARTLLKQLLGASSLLALLDDDADAHALRDIRFSVTNAHLDVYKTLLDIVFNSYTVFRAPLHFDTVQIWMGISASLLSSIKLYREKRRAMAAPKS